VTVERLRAYGIAIAAVAVAVALRAALQPLLADEVPFITMFVAVGVAAYYGGRGPALLALLSSAAATDYFFIQPRFSLAVPALQHRVALVVYGLVGASLIVVVESLRRALWRAEEKQRQLESEVAARRAAEAELSARQRALQAGEERFRTIFQTAGVSLWEEDFSEVEAAIAWLRAEGVTDFARYFEEHPEFVQRAMGLVSVVDVNDATVRLFEAADKTELLGSLPTIFPPESTHVFMGELLAVAEGRSSFEAEVLLSTVKGNPVYVLFTMVLPTAGRRYDRVLFSVFDLTERRTVEERLRERDAQLREADRRKDEFLATLAHELRNPLAPIRNALAMLELAGDDATVLNQARAVMQRQVNQMVRLIDDLLDVSRISRGRLEIRREPTDLSEIIHAALETSRPAVELSGHEVFMTLPEQGVQLYADPVRLTQVFSNLLTNAANFTPDGGRITVTAERRGTEVDVSVKDNGIGLPGDRLERVFDMFEQMDHALERQHGGLGIGLALARELVTLHGGNISGRSEGAGRGSEFVVTLPVLGDTMPSPVHEEPVERRAGLSILVVDDNHDSAESLATLLRDSWGTRRTPRTTVSKLSRWRIDCGLS
jgi:signal transduction histidine kinase